MKKTTFIIAFLAAMFSVNASAQKLVVPDVNFGDGSTADLVVSVESQNVAALVEFELALPEGVTIEKDDEGYFYDFGEILRASGRKPHSITVEDRDNGNIYVLVCDPKGGTFEAASGTVVILPLVMGDTFSGSGKGTLSKIILSDVDANQMTSVTTIEFNITAGEVIVGVRDIRADSEDGKLYNTAGQRVVKAGKGLYIQNGKKVVKK